MCKNVILKNPGMLQSIPNCYKRYKMCKKVVDCYCYALEYGPYCFMTQETC